MKTFVPHGMIIDPNEIGDPPPVYAEWASSYSQAAKLREAMHEDGEECRALAHAYFCRANTARIHWMQVNGKWVRRATAMRKD